MSDKKLKDLQARKFQAPITAALALCMASLPGTTHACQIRIASVIAELDPFCVTQNHPDLFGVKDPNPCMAGDRLLAKVLRKKEDPTQKEITKFLTRLEREIAASKTHSSIDLWGLYLKDHEDTPGGRKKFLALLTFFYYSLGAAGGYVDGLADYYWRNSLKESNEPEGIFEEYYSLRQKVDWYRHLVNESARAKKLNLSLKKVDLRGMNRHDFMAMFLSCHFRSHGELMSRILPNILGVGYESLDFISHIEGEVGVRGSLQNFQRDTSRYSMGSALGNGFCAYKL